MNPMKPVRKARELELLSMRPSDEGWNEICRLYRMAAGIQEHEGITYGTLASDMIEAILNYEYPPKA